MRASRRDNVAPALVLGLAGTAAAGTAGSLWLGTGALSPFIAAAVFLILTSAVVYVTGGAHPFDRFGPANTVTVIRAMLAGLAAGLVAAPAAPRLAWCAVVVAVVVAILDGVDGWLARRTAMSSPFGARFDMETDAAFILVLSILVWQQEKAGAWVLLCGLMRYLFVAAGWVIPFLTRPLRSTRRGKTVAVVQFLGLSAALAPVIAPPASAVVALLTLTALVWSFAVDVIWLARQ